MVDIVQISTETHKQQVLALMDDYLAWTKTFMGDKLADVPTFEKVDDELSDLPGIFAPEKGGAFLLAYHDDQPAGCVALKKVNATTGELKRMYVSPDYRGKGIGWQLAQTWLTQAQALGYTKLVLDSHISMKKAHKIYQALGFQQVPPPDDFPDALKSEVVFMEMTL